MDNMTLWDVLLSIAIGGIFGWIFGQVYNWINRKE